MMSIRCDQFEWTTYLLEQVVMGFFVLPIMGYLVEMNAGLTSLSVGALGVNSVGDIFAGMITILYFSFY